MKADKEDALGAIDALMNYHEDEDSEGAKPHVGKQDIAAAKGKKRLGAPKAIKSAKGKTVVEPIRITPPDRVTAHVLLVGDSPLITNCWSWKVIRQMLREHLQVPNAITKVRGKRVREAKNPFEIFKNSMYEFPGGGYAFPSNGIKKALISACSFTNGVAPKFVGGAVQVNFEMTSIRGWPKARFDMVTLKDNFGNRKPDTRFRGQFDEWAAEVQISYTRSIIDLKDIVNLFMWAGSAVGIGEWRMEKDGNFGSFHVASKEELEDIRNRIPIADRSLMTEERSGIGEILEKFKVYVELEDLDGVEETDE